jgi:starch synthase (maltosyl-transferring)
MTIDYEPYPGKEENNHSEKYELKEWDWYAEGHINNEIRRINKIRQDHPAFQRTGNIRFIPCTNDQIIAFIKEDFRKTDRWIIVINMDWHQRQVGNLQLPSSLFNPSKYSLDLIDFFSPQKASYTWNSQTAYVELDPQNTCAHLLQIVTPN